MTLQLLFLYPLSFILYVLKPNETKKMYSYERKPYFFNLTFLNILLQEGGGDGDGDNYYDDWLQ